MLNQSPLPYCQDCGNSINHSEPNTPMVCSGYIIFNSNLTECKRMAYINGREIYAEEKQIIDMDRGVAYTSDLTTQYLLRDGQTNQHVGMIIGGRLGWTYFARY